MKLIFFIIVVSLAIVSAPELSLAGDFMSLTENLMVNLNVVGGKSALNEADWEPVAGQTKGGVVVDFRKETWPVRLMAGHTVSDSNGKVRDGNAATTRSYSDPEMTETLVGAKKIWDVRSNFRSYVGAGFVRVETKVRAGEDIIFNPFGNNFHFANYEKATAMGLSQMSVLTGNSENQSTWVLTWPYRRPKQNCLGLRLEWAACISV